MERRERKSVFVREKRDIKENMAKSFSNIYIRIEGEKIKKRTRT